MNAGDASLPLGKEQVELAEQEESYSDAVALAEAERYEEAIAAFEALGDFKGCADKVKSLNEQRAERYAEAEALVADGNKSSAAVGNNDAGQCNVSGWTDIKLPNR